MSASNSRPANSRNSRQANDAQPNDAQANEEQAKEEQAKEEQVKDGQVKDSQVKDGQVKDSQVKDSQVKDSQGERRRLTARTLEASVPETDDPAAPCKDDLLPGGPSANLADLSYEQARAALEEVVGALEAATVSLEDSLALWERGNRLADIAQAHLDGARDRIANLRPDLLADNS